jgi:hypothetical protein
MHAHQQLMDRDELLMEIRERLQQAQSYQKMQYDQVSVTHHGA